MREGNEDRYNPTEVFLQVEVQNIGITRVRRVAQLRRSLPGSRG